ncbi:MAG TPA: Rieske 2Fe-2S domain-containing protein [Actinomycetota bacterium]
MSTLALSTGLWAALVVLLALNVFAIVFGLSFLRANKAAQAQAAGTEITPSKPVKAVSRRDFFRTSLIVSFAVFAAEFGGATIAFLWPNLKGGFGSVIAAGNIDDILAEIADTGGPVYNGAGRFYLVPYDGTATGDVDYAAEGVAAQGIMPLYQRCVHLGCRVPFCASSKWFECPCHGSKYNEAGEYRLGPAPKGLDRFKITIDEGGNVFVDTSTIVSGPPRGTDTTDQPPQGAFCVAAG